MELPRLHLVADERIARLPDLDERTRRVSGVPAIALHARGHSLTGREHLELARRFAAVLPQQVFVYDRLDVALAVDAAGVQLSASGLTPRDARRISSRWWIGASVHTLAEASAARDGGADYLLVGPVFATPTHPEAPALGLAELTRFAGLGAPVLAIGGISPANARSVMGAGAYGVAVIRAVWDAPDPARAAAEIMKEIAWKSS